MKLFAKLFLGILGIVFMTGSLYAACAAAQSTPITGIAYDPAGSMIGCNPALLPNLYYFITDIPAGNTSQFNSDLSAGVDMGNITQANTWLCNTVLVPNIYLVNTNWNRAGYDGCPARTVGTDRTVLIVMDRLNEGAATHSTSIAIARKRYTASGFAFTLINNGGACYTFPTACMLTLPMPIPQITNVTRTAASIAIDVTFARPTFNATDPAYWLTTDNNLPAAGDHTADLSRAINSYQLYYQVADSNSAPTTSAVGSWTAVGATVAYAPGTASQSVSISIPNTGCSGSDCLNDYAWLALGLNVNDAKVGSPIFALPYVSANSAVIAPTPVTFQSFTGKYGTLQQINLNWVTASETDAMGFNLYRSIDGANWTKVNSALIPVKGVGGAGAAYAYTDNLPKQRIYQPFKYKIEEMSNTGTRIDATTTDVTK